MDDSTLIQAVWQGHSEAFGALVERYQERVLRLCYYVTGNSTDAEDLAHEAFIEAYVKLRQLRDPQKFAPWLKRIALNLCRMWYRRNRLDTVAWLQEPCAEADESQDALYQRMFQGLTQLSAPHRLALILHYWEGLSYEE